MRKLNKQNKAYISILSIFTALIFVAIVVFIIYKIKDINIKYLVDANSYTFNTDKELIVTEDSYIKKDFLSRYFLHQNDEKVNLGSNTIVYNASAHNIQLFGTFYEILHDGEINKLKGESNISTVEKNRIFKINDRKYLIVGPNIKSTDDGLLSTKGFLLIDLDKVGNGLLYNNELNIKTFKDLHIENSDFTFKINEELLTIGEEEIDLAKINGSSNEYAAKKKTPEDENGTGEGGTGTGGNGANENLLPTPEKEEKKIPDPIIEEKYISRKTSVLNSSSTANSITVNYIVYDPFTEYTALYLVLYDSRNNKIGTYELDMNDTSYTIDDLNASETYRLYFYYSYVEEDQTVNTLFDTLDVMTKNINAKLALEMINENSVRYMVRVDGKYELDSATVVLSVTNGDDITIYTHNLSKKDLIKAASDDGLVDVFENIDLTGEFIKLTLKDCIYNGKKIDTEANYKVKM